MTTFSLVTENVVTKGQISYSEYWNPKPIILTLLKCYTWTSWSWRQHALFGLHFCRFFVEKLLQRFDICEIKRWLENMFTENVVIFLWKIVVQTSFFVFLDLISSFQVADLSFFLEGNTFWCHINVKECLHCREKFGLAQKSQKGKRSFIRTCPLRETNRGHPINVFVTLNATHFMYKMFFECSNILFNDVNF